MNFKLLNRIGGWFAFVVALVTYTLTVEPTASFWDCGEFIACAFKLQVPHPAGAPFFLLLGRIASLFAFGDVTKVALMVNMISVIASAFTILFLFWTITLLGRKFYNKKGDELSQLETLAVVLSGLVGSLAYTFSDSFWFSAVEAEVYGLSSFFTAIVVWAAFQWETIEDESAANRWLIFIAYLVGLSIGVHLLNLVTVPALALIYYYKKTKKITWKGGIIAFLMGMVVLGIVNSGVITGIPSIGFAFERVFVNTFGLPFSSGLIFFLLALIGALTYGIIKTGQQGKVIANTALLSFAFILIGYSTYTIALIRSSYNPPINENDPSNVLNYVSYLKREQYGSRPLLYGPVYTTQLTAITQGEPMYKMGKDKYEIYDYASEYTWDPKGQMLLPRVWSQDPNHVSLYRSRLGLPDGQEPNLADNLRFMFSDQMGRMYWRYFMWNFWGRAADFEGSGAVNIFESKADLPQVIASNKGRTNFYGLPILLGIIGVLVQFMRRDKDFIVVFLLFLFTGLALVVYLNSPPVEPRERDYIYVGSFYFFAIWIGLSIIGIIDFTERWLKNSMVKTGVVGALALIVPVQMATQTWAGHDRSDRYHQIDFAKNLLNSCAPNAILFTGGDNDTFPLWYAQEVEGIRTDVRVCNLSLLGTEWYIEQMKRQTYESTPLPISLSMEHYNKGINDQIPFVKNSNPAIQEGINLEQYLNLIRENNPAIKMPVTSGKQISILPSANLFFTIDAEKLKAKSFIPEEYKPLVQNEFKWNIGERDLLKNDLIVLDIIAQNKFERPIYFAGYLSPSSYLNLKEYCLLEGYAYRLMPFRLPEAKDGGVNVEVMYENVMKKMAWRELNNPDVYYDSETYKKVPIITARYSFLRLADELIQKGDKTRAKEVLDYGLKVIPDESIPYDQLSANYTLFYYELGDKQTARKIGDTLIKRAEESLVYYIGKSRQPDSQWSMSMIQENIGAQLRILQVLGNIANQYGDAEQATRIEKKYGTFAQQLGLQ